MTTTTPAKILRFPVPPAPQRQMAREAAERRERRARVVVTALIVLVLALFWAGVALEARGQAAAVRELPAATRHSLFSRAMSEIDSVCRDLAASSGDLRTHCLEEARFALLFPECDDACRRASAVILPHASR
jgi:hypothetical protein